MGDAAHLVGRFVRSIVPRGPDAEAEEWLVTLLSPAELDLYEAQSRLDRRHSVRCAQAARSELGERASCHSIVASALHDVGKSDSGLGTLGRVVATLVARSTSEARLDKWEGGRGFRRRVASYARHDRRGAELLTRAGSHACVIAWAREHHNDPADWTLPEDVGAALAAADR